MSAHPRWSLPLLLVAAAVLLASLGAWAQQDLSLRAEVADGLVEVPFGTPITVRVSLRWSAHREEFTPPSVEAIELPQAEVLDRYTVSPEQLAGGQDGLDYHLVLTRFEPSEQALGPVVLTVGDRRLSSRALPFRFTGATPKEGDQPEQVRPPQPPQEISTDAFWSRLGRLLGALGLGLALLALVAHRLRLLDRLLSPERRTIRRLNGLRKRLLSGEAEPRTALIELDALYRRYLTGRTDLPANSSTATELVRLVKERDLPAGWSRFTQELVAAADPVKFAKASITAKKSSELIASLLELLRKGGTR